MSTRNRREMRTLYLVGIVLAAGLTAQAAMADYDASHELRDRIVPERLLGVAEPPGPQGEVLFANTHGPRMKVASAVGMGIAWPQSAGDEPN